MKIISGARVIAVWLTILMLAFFLAVAALSLTLCILEKVREPSRIAPDKLKAAMKYHGIEYAECDWSDRCYFYREGRRVRF